MLIIVLFYIVVQKIDDFSLFIFDYKIYEIMFVKDNYLINQVVIYSKILYDEL